MIPGLLVQEILTALTAIMNTCPEVSFRITLLYLERWVPLNAQPATELAEGENEMSNIKTITVQYGFCCILE